MHGITNAELALLFSMFTLAPSVGFTLVFFVLAKVFKEKETTHKILNIVWKIGVAAIVISLAICAWVYFS